VREGEREREREREGEGEREMGYLSMEIVEFAVAFLYAPATVSQHQVHLIHLKRGAQRERERGREAEIREEKGSERERVFRFCLTHSLIPTEDTQKERERETQRDRERDVRK
jgi:hypothetical protein